MKACLVFGSQEAEIAPLSANGLLSYSYLVPLLGPASGTVLLTQGVSSQR